MIAIRRGAAEDGPALGRLMHAAIHGATGAAYGPAERDAWAPRPPEGEAWAARLARQRVWVAEEGGGGLAGFITLAEDGLIDLAFTAPEKVGRGVGGALYAALEDAALASGMALLSVEASLIAEPFFARRGFTLLRRNRLERGGVILRNASMEKRLAS